MQHVSPEPKEFFTRISQEINGVLAQSRENTTWFWRSQLDSWIGKGIDEFMKQPALLYSLSEQLAAANRENADLRQEKQVAQAALNASQEQCIEALGKVSEQNNQVNPLPPPSPVCISRVLELILDHIRSMSRHMRKYRSTLPTSRT